MTQPTGTTSPGLGARRRRVATLIVWLVIIALAIIITFGIIRPALGG
jgi:hypothetical protein